MEQLNALKDLLLSFPNWGDTRLEVDKLQSDPTQCGLFPLGLQVRRRQEDVLGNTVFHLRQSFLLRRAAYCAEDASAWLLQLQNWLIAQKPLWPFFGKNLRFSGENGRLVTGKQPGTGIYELKIHVDYEKE